VKARRVKKLDPAASLAENAARIVLVRLDELRSFAPRALEPDQARAQHDMRIAAKRLRYILETTEMCFGKPAEVARRQARDLQGVLGDLHDCDVMLPRVERHLARLREADAGAIRSAAAEGEDVDPALAARAPNRTAYRGLELLAAFIGARRRFLHDRLRALWEAQEGGGTWRDLHGAAKRALREPPDPRAAPVEGPAPRGERPVPPYVPAA
jgi:CHAD domain